MAAEACNYRPPRAARAATTGPVVTETAACSGFLPLQSVRSAA